MARTNLPQRLRRDTVELMHEAAAWLGPDADETAIHEARKSIKRARALTALLRSAGGAAASRVNEELCTINRQLSPRRDRDVLQATFLKLLGKSAEHAELQQFLADRESANATLPESAMTLETLAEALLQAAEDWKRTELPRGDWSLIADDFRQVFLGVDGIAGPVAPTVAWDLGSRTDDPLANYLADVYTLPASLAGLPGLSMPVGFGAGGRPVGLQLIGNYFDEARLLQIGAP